MIFYVPVPIGTSHASRLELVLLFDRFQLVEIMSDRFIMVDGNLAAANIAYQTNEVIAIYPITPASPMGELSDAWASAKRLNIFGGVPQVIEMQSEGGAAGVVHGSLQAGSLTTTFTASQGLLLMLPNMYKIAGELNSAVMHVAARSLATHALSIFGDHSDVMSARGTGWAMLCSSNVQEAQDFALIAQAATLEARVPFIHFFDGFRTSHEINKIEPIASETIRDLLDEQGMAAHFDRRLTPDRPVLRGTAQNPDVFFQAREAANTFYDRLPNAVQQAMDRFADLTDRSYGLVDYVGDPAATRVIVMMGSGCGATEEAVNWMNDRGARVGLVKVRLYRPFPAAALLDALPPNLESIAVLDRTKEPGASGEPLYLDVVSSIDRAAQNGFFEGRARPKIIGGRYGLSSKEFTPSMAAAVFEELLATSSKTGFTIGINDDVTHLSLPWDAELIPESDDVVRAVFFGLGSDGTVGANKNTVKIIGEHTPLYAQGYFVYDSKKAGAVTVSHLRFSPRRIDSTYLIDQASFVGCSQFQFLEHLDMLDNAADGAVFLLNSPYAADDVWQHLSNEVQRQIIDKHLSFYVVDADEIARQTKLGRRTNTVMQACFFALTEMLAPEQALTYIRKSIEESYSKRGPEILKRNFEAIEKGVAGLQQVSVPGAASSEFHRRPAINEDASDFVKRVTSAILAGHGERLPVSALPVDGTFPTDTARFEKRGIAREIPIWDQEICIECGLCAFVCPHSAIRMKSFSQDALKNQPQGFVSRVRTSRDLPGDRLTIQVAPDDCTGCGVCVDVCPARSKEVLKHKAIDMAPMTEHEDRERANFEFFLSIPEIDRSSISHSTVKASQLLQPLFEFSGACAGCGETPYLKLLTQLFGDRMIVANATGCSSIYGGNLPTTPWSQNQDGRGPAWSNSLFEDNAEFGLGMRLAIDQQRDAARRALSLFDDRIDSALKTRILQNRQNSEVDIVQQRDNVERLKEYLQAIDEDDARRLHALADCLVDKNVWIVGGDGWAYDIGFGGLDHVLASGHNVNVIVLDTEVYSNTGGQASKSTPRAAIAKYATEGKAIGKKDLGLLAIQYGNVYVGQIAMGAQPLQAIRAMQEAASYQGPSLLLAYSQCVAHGIDMTRGMTHQKDAVQSGYWPLYRYDPRLAHDGGRPFQLDSRAPRKKFKDFAASEARFAMLERSNPNRAQELFEMAQLDINERHHYYQQLAGVERELVHGEARSNNALGTE